jgi:hypothetical protein
MRKEHFLIISAMLVVFGLAVFGGFSEESLISPIETNAQTQSNPFNEINALAQQNKLNPTHKRSKSITNKVIDALSVLNIPATSKDEVATQVATAHLNGTSSIDENNIANALNNLASQASAPNYAYTDVEQVKVVRKFLNRLMPDLVSSNGYMNDIEAIAVFTGILSQKFDNEAFMVTTSEFITSLSGPNNQPFPGTSAANTGTVEASQTTLKMNEMETALGNYVSSQNLATPTNIVNSIGIQ